MDPRSADDSALCDSRCIDIAFPVACDPASEDLCRDISAARPMVADQDAQALP